MSNLLKEFEEIKATHQNKIQSLETELNDGYFHTFLNLRKEYKEYIFELNDLFDKYDHIVPYELYEFFYRVSCGQYNLLFDYAEYVEGSGNLPGAFLKEAIADLEIWSIHTLLQLEKKNNYTKKDPSAQLLSLEAYDAILETQSNRTHTRGYAFREEKVSEAYASAARTILSNLGTDAAEKACAYYKTAKALLEASSASITHNSPVYYTYYISLYNLLRSYKQDIEKYGIACDFNIEQEISECVHKNYQQAHNLMCTLEDK